MTNLTQRFNYGALEATTRDTVKEKTSAIHDRVRDIKHRFVEIGNLLIDVKASLKHGEWGAWLEAEFGWSQDTATRLMNVAELVRQNPQFAEFGDRFTRTALYMLAADAPHAALNEAVERAADGEKINDVKAGQIVARHTPVAVGRSGVNFAGEGVEPDLDENGQPLVRRAAELTAEDVPKGTWVRWRGKRFEVRGYNYGSGNLWLVDERGKRSWVPLREVTRIDDEATEERVVERIDDDDEEEAFRLGDIVDYRGHRCTVVAVSSSGRLSLKTSGIGQPLHGIDPDIYDVKLIERAADRQPPKAAPAAPVADLREGDRVITRTGHEGVITRDGGDRRVTVETVNGSSTHLRETLTKVEPVAPPLAEEIVTIDDVPVAETHPMGWKLLHIEGSWATCVNCGESHARWSAVRGSDWRCDMPNCRRLTHDDLLIPYTKEDADAARRNARRNGSGTKQFTPLPQHLSGSVEWYTPAEYVEAARAVMGDIDLDPASCELANKTVNAGQFYTAAEDGLKQVWSGRVWLNPPYGMTDENSSSQGAWSARIIRAWESGEIEEGILLVNAATAQKWFAPLWQYPICFTDHRIRFVSPNGDKDQPPHGSVFVYFGNHPDRFAQCFAQFGPVVVRVVREAAAQP